MKLHIFIKDQFNRVLLDKEVFLDYIQKKGKESYELPDDFSINLLIDEAKHLLRNNETVDN